MPKSPSESSDPDSLSPDEAFALLGHDTRIGILQTLWASLVGRNMIVDEERGIADLPDDVVRDAFYGDCTDEDVALARALLRPEPLGPYRVPITTTDERFGSVPRVYVETLEDNALTLAFQTAMYTDRPCEAVYTLEASHSSFLSAPDALVDHLLAV